MNLGVCLGCGAPLQTDNPAAPGYIPSEVAQADGRRIVCRRCYRITHYKKDDVGPPAAEALRERLIARVQRAALTILVVDLIDFEGSFDRQLAKAAGGRLLVAANKADLLPARTPWTEVAEWVSARLQAAGVSARGVFVISGQAREGVHALLRTACSLVEPGAEILLVGATNVGKSTLLASWLEDGAAAPTISRFPGTTLGELTRELIAWGVRIVDTPGLAPKGRLSDLLCPACAVRLVPERRLQTRLVGLRSGQAVAWGGLAAVQLLGVEPAMPPDVELPLLFFAADGVQAERLREARAQVELLLRQGGWRRSAVVCEGCARRLLAGGTEEVRLDVGPYEDVAIHGLGWFSPRLKAPEAPGAHCRMRISLPAGVRVTVRPRLVGPKPGAGAPAGRARS